MRRCHSASHYAVARTYPDERIEQTIAMQMSKLVPTGGEADATEAMHTELDAKRTARLEFERFPHRKRTPIKESRRHEQHRIEDLRKQWHAREPSQLPDNKGENHEIRRLPIAPAKAEDSEVH